MHPTPIPSLLGRHHILDKVAKKPKPFRRYRYDWDTKKWYLMIPMARDFNGDVRLYVKNITPYVP